MLNPLDEEILQVEAEGLDFTQSPPELGTNNNSAESSYFSGNSVGNAFYSACASGYRTNIFKY